MSTQEANLTVVLVTYQRTSLFQRALNSLARAVANSSIKIELRILINGRDPDSWSACNQITSLFPNSENQIIQLNHSVTPAEARNKLSLNILSEWIFFMDDDIVVPEDYFKNFKKLCEEIPYADLWGGPNLTPETSQYVASRNGWLVQNYLVVGPVSKRYRKKGSDRSQAGQFDLMLCNLFLKTKLFESTPFAPHLKTAEENDLIYRLKKKNSNLLYSDDLFVWHERRGNSKSFLKQIFYYGYGRGQLLLSGNLFSQWYFALLPLLSILFLLLTINFPILILTILFLWLSLIQVMYFRYSNRFDLGVFLFPLAIWILYPMGICKGVWVSVRDQVREELF